MLYGVILWYCSQFLNYEERNRVLSSSVAVIFNLINFMYVRAQNS